MSAMQKHHCSGLLPILPAFKHCMMFYPSNILPNILFCKIQGHQIFSFSTFTCRWSFTKTILQNVSCKKMNEKSSPVKISKTCQHQKFRGLSGPQHLICQHEWKPLLNMQNKSICFFHRVLFWGFISELQSSL